jgi:hypothetical protein
VICEIEIRAADLGVRVSEPRATTFEVVELAIDSLAILQRLGGAFENYRQRKCALDPNSPITGTSLERSIDRRV